MILDFCTSFADRLVGGLGWQLKIDLCGHWSALGVRLQVGMSCPFKLLYRKQGLQTLKSHDPMLDFLAEGGFMIEALAHAVLSDQPNCEFESTIRDGRLHARVDALLDDGDQGPPYRN